MIMLKALKHAAQHDVLKVMRTLIFGYERFVREHESEMATPPCHGVIVANKSVCDARNGALTGLSSAFPMEVDVEGQKKAALRRRCDLCFKLDELHD